LPEKPHSPHNARQTGRVQTFGKLLLDDPARNFHTYRDATMMVPGMDKATASSLDR
jgi:hypothetical protein